MIKKNQIIQRNYNIPASYLALIQNGKILLLKRFNTGYEDGKYSMVAGHVEEGETFTEAIIREAYEEAGVELQAEDIKVAHVMHRKSIDSERVDVFFTAENWQGKIDNKEPGKCNELAWFDLDQLPENAIPYIKQAINCIRNKVYYSECGWN